MADATIASNQSVGRTVISGGTVNVGPGCVFCVGYGQYSTGYLHLDSGTLRLGSPFCIKETSDTSFVKWSGGTIAIAEGFSGDSLVSGVFSNGNEGSRRFSMEIAGTGSARTAASGRRPIPLRYTAAVS